MRRLGVDFTGTGEAFRRLWRRHLLVNLALGGFYTPIAKRRTAEWFAAHTLIDGTALETVPVAKSRWPALVLIALFIALRIATDAGYGPPLPLVIAAGTVMLPYLWGITAARRVNTTRWRGLQFEFTASWREIYSASWPLFALAVPWAIVAPQVAAGTAGGEFHLARGLVEFLAVLVLAAYPLLVRLAFNYKRLLVTRTRIGGHEVIWQPRFARYFAIWLTTTLAFAVSVFPIVLGLRYALFGTVGRPEGLTGPAAIAVPLAGAVLAILLSAPARAWHEARMFRLLWNEARVDGIARFECTLDVKRFVRLRASNLLHLARRPFGLVEEYRTKAGSVTVFTETT